MGVSLRDVDGGGDLDAFVANLSNQPNRVWLNLPDTDMDGVPDVNYNFPDDANPDQENLDDDSVGNLCDDDVDGEGTLNDDDPDDDEDEILDVNEPADPGGNPHAIDPDTDSRKTCSRG